MGEQPLNVLSHHINLDIHVVARFEMRQVGDFPGLRDNGYLEVFVGESGDRQTDSLDRYGAFEDEISREFRRIFDLDGPGLAVILDSEELPTTIDVTLNDVTAEPR